MICLNLHLFNKCPIIMFLQEAFFLAVSFFTISWTDVSVNSICLSSCRVNQQLRGTIWGWKEGTGRTIISSMSRCIFLLTSVIRSHYERSPLQANVKEQGDKTLSSVTWLKTEIRGRSEANRKEPGRIKFIFIYHFEIKQSYFHGLSA